MKRNFEELKLVRFKLKKRVFFGIAKYRKERRLAGCKAPKEEKDVEVELHEPDSDGEREDDDYEHVRFGEDLILGDVCLE